MELLTIFHDKLNSLSLYTKSLEKILKFTKFWLD